MKKIDNWRACMEGSIFVLDKSAFTGEICKCGSEVGFVIGIYGQLSQLCSECMANVGKKIIDGLT
jgi:hypothetical protein